jgi:hypothetical protein
MRQARPQALAARGTAAEAGHLRVEPGLVNEDQAIRVELRLAGEPGEPRFRDIGALLLARMSGLFFTVKPRRAKKRQIVVRAARTPRSASRRARISSSVMSTCPSSSPRRKSSCASSADLFGLPCRRAVRSPVSRHRRTQRTAVAMPIPKRAAADRADAPLETATITRSRKSPE